jgi:hypothetical protein
MQSAIVLDGGGDVCRCLFTVIPQNRRRFRQVGRCVKEKHLCHRDLSGKEGATERHSLSCRAFFAGLMTRLVTLKKKVRRDNAAGQWCWPQSGELIY